MLSLLLLCALLLSSCAGTIPADASFTPASANPQTAAPRFTPAPIPTPTLPDTNALLQGQAGAYYAGLQWFFREEASDGLHRDAIYMAVDLSNILLEEQDGLITLLEMFCEQHGYTLLQATFEELQEEGYITTLYFEEGVLITFRDELCTADKLVTDVEEWRAGMAAVGAKLTIEKVSGEWAVTGMTDMWIS